MATYISEMEQLRAMHFDAINGQSDDGSAGTFSVIMISKLKIKKNSNLKEQVIGLL